MVSKKTKGAIPKQLRGWHAVVEKVKNAKGNENLPYKKILEKASAEYKKVKKSMGV